MGEQVVVSVGGRRFEVAPGDVFTFGRAESCTVCLDPDDLGISRLAGSIEHASGTWWILNRSTVRPIDVIDEIGIRAVLAPGRRLAVASPLTVVVEGSTRRHALEVDAGSFRAGAPLDQPIDALPTSKADDVVISHLDRQALVAVFGGYLEPFPRYDPHPRSYADAAVRLGWPRSTLVKRIEYLRTRLSNAGVPNLFGENALPHLAEWALATRVITREDLDLLPER
ncbi:MAG: hypothetical protein J2P57_02790 [Acidimicrobiaceae bacterium]|nr:hypothetical protein [Acidimicrobiaceae bacterium]